MEKELNYNEEVFRRLLTEFSENFPQAAQLYAQAKLERKRDWNLFKKLIYELCDSNLIYEKVEGQYLLYCGDYFAIVFLSQIPIFDLEVLDKVCSCLCTDRGIDLLLNLVPNLVYSGVEHKEIIRALSVRKELIKLEG